MPCARRPRPAQGIAFRRAIALLILAAVLAGCSALNIPNPFAPPSPVPASPTATAEPTASPTATPNPADGPQTLTLWLPPRFDPKSGAAGQLLEARLQMFAAQNPGLTINVRIKAETGTSGLLAALGAAAPAAPAALPGLVAFSREDMQIAALRGLIYPLEDYSQILNSPDWYDYSREIARVQGSSMCLPFAGDALALLYRPALAGNPLGTWDELVNQAIPLAFSAGDPQALVTLALYRSAGGTTEDAQQRPTLQRDPLESVLKLYLRGAAVGTFPAWLPTITNTEQAWQAYTDQRVHLAVGWVSTYLGSPPADTSLAPLPGLEGQAASLATAWGWCIAEPDPAKRELAVRLAEFLVDAKFMGEWTAAAGYLPTRPNALASWSNQSLRTTVGFIAAPAHALAPSDQLYTLGPILENAAVQVLRQQVDPASAANAAVKPFVSQ